MTTAVWKNVGKTLAAAAAGVLLVLGAAACGPNAGTPSEAGGTATGSSAQGGSAAKARTLDEIKQSGELRVAVFSDKAPFGYVDKDGNYAGYDVVFAERLAKDLGGKPVYTSVDPAARGDVRSSN